MFPVQRIAVALLFTSVVVEQKRFLLLKRRFTPLFSGGR
jgi:hypothetical protein